MNLIRKILISMSLALILNLGLISTSVFAQGGTLLPGTAETVASCEMIIKAVNIHRNPSNNSAGAEEIIAKRKSFYLDGTRFTIIEDTGGDALRGRDILACGIKTGGMKLWMVPFYLRFLLEFVIGISGLIAVGGIVYGGYMYLFAGISDDKEKGKKAILYGIVGFVMTLVAFAFVNIVIALVT